MMKSEFEDLPDIQRVLLATMIEQGKDFTPFSETSKKNCASRLGRKSVAITAIQRALEGLRTKDLVWRSAYGAYALEDESLIEWYRHRSGGQKHRAFSSCATPASPGRNISACQ
jgi:hypothetical protein